MTTSTPEQSTTEQLLPVESFIPIHTSDRISFRRCRRKWYLSSPIRRNMVYVGDTAAPLWFGSGFHFALEDFHGRGDYGDPLLAFRAYYEATRRVHPPEAAELLGLAAGMLSHYRHWVSRRNEFTTLVVRGVPQVEVQWEVPLARGVVYRGTFDRVVTDPYGRVWLVDYKTAQRFNTSKLDNDPQVSAYCWAGRELYGIVPEGMVYMQFLKAAPAPPRQLMDGSLSTNKQQPTSYALFKAAAIAEYGEFRRFPEKYRSYLGYLAALETPEGDHFIRRDLCRRNEAFIDSEEWKLRAEISEMLNPTLPLYPNPTRDCSWDCNFKGVCLAMDDGSDWEHILQEEYTPRIGGTTPWREQLPDPQTLLRMLDLEREGMASTQP